MLPPPRASTAQPAAAADAPSHGIVGGATVTAAAAGPPLSSAPPIRIALWNTGGAGILGFEHHVGHIEDAIRPGGPLYSADVLVITEAKLRDGALIPTLGRRLAVAHNGGPTRSRLPILFCTALSAAHSTGHDDDDTQLDAADRAMRVSNRRPWAGVLVIVVNPLLRPWNMGGSKLGLLCIKLEWRPLVARISRQAGGAAAHSQPAPPPATPPRCPPHPLILFALYNPAADSNANKTPREAHLPTHSELLLTELKTRYAEMRRRYDCVLVAADWNMRLGRARHAPRGARGPAGSDATALRSRAELRRERATNFPRRVTEDACPKSRAAARTTTMARLCREMSVTVAHGSFPHQAAGFMTSGPVAAGGADRRGAAEVDAFLAPWSALRTTDASPDVPMRITALQPCMGWPGDRDADGEAHSDDIAHDSEGGGADSASAPGESAPGSDADEADDDDDANSVPPSGGARRERPGGAVPARAPAAATGAAPSLSESRALPAAYHPPAANSDSDTSDSDASGDGAEGAVPEVDRQRQRQREIAAVAVVAATQRLPPIPDALTHVPVMIDVYLGSRKAVGNAALDHPESDPRGLPPHTPHADSPHPRRVPYPDRAYYRRIFPAVARWAKGVIAAARAASEAAGGANLAPAAVSMIYADAIRGLRSAAVQPDPHANANRDPSQSNPQHLAEKYRRLARRAARRRNKLLSTLRRQAPDLDPAGIRALVAAPPDPTLPPPAAVAACGGERRAGPSSVVHDARTYALAASVKAAIDEQRLYQRRAARVARKDVREQLHVVTGALEKQRRADPSGFFRSVEQLTQSAPTGPGYVLAPLYGPTINFAVDTFTESRPMPGVVNGDWDRDMPSAELPQPPPAFPPPCGPPGQRGHDAYLDALEHEVYLHLFPVTRESASKYRAPCADAGACPLCTDFNERRLAFLLRPTAIDNLPPIFPGRVNTGKGSGTDGIVAEVLECAAPPKPGELPARQRAPPGAGDGDASPRNDGAEPACEDDLAALPIYEYRRLVARAIAAMMEPWFRTGVMPDSADFGVVLMSMLGKPGAADPRDPSQGRPIAVDNLLPKLYDAITNSRIAHHLARHALLSPSQVGFLPARSSEMHAFGHRALVQHCLATGRTVVSLFVDVKGAYPSMDWRALEYVLRKYGVPDDAVRAYMNRLRRTSVTVRNGKVLSALIEASKGLQQGQVSAPLSWNIFYDPLLRRIHRLIPGVSVRFVRRADGPAAAGTGAASPGSATGSAGGEPPAGEQPPAHLEEAPERAFADDLVIYIAFDGTPTHVAVAQRVRDVLAILSDYERDFNVALGLGVKKTAIVVSPCNAESLDDAGRASWCSPSFAPVPIPAPGTVWSPRGERIASAPTSPAEPPPPPPADAGGGASAPPVRAVSATSTYKYLGDIFEANLSPAATREAFVARLVKKLTSTLKRLFSYNRVTLRLCVATKMQLLGTLMLGATSYLLAVHRLSATDLDRVEAPVRRALMEILGLPARGGAMMTAALMEAPAVVPFTLLSLSHRLRLLHTLRCMPRFAASPPASLVQRLAGAREAALASDTRPPIPNPLPPSGAVAGVTALRDAQHDLAGIGAGSGATGRNRDEEPPADWSEPATLRAVIPAIQRLRTTASYHLIGMKHFSRWAQRRPLAAGAPAATQALPGRGSAVRAAQSPHRSVSRAGDADPRLALVSRPPPSQLGHLEAIYYAPYHNRPSDAGPADASAVTRLSWTGPGGGGRLLALCQLPTRTACVVARARLGSTCLRLWPFSRPWDRVAPLTAVERDAVCRACRREAGGKLMLCDGFCGEALHWTAACVGAAGATSVLDHGGARRRRRRAAPGVGPMPPRWFCSQPCADFHDAAVADDVARSLDGPSPRGGCRMCDADTNAANDPTCNQRPERGDANGAAPPPAGSNSTPASGAVTEDLWHLLFDCPHPVMRELREDTRLSSISHYTALCDSLVAASERAERWYPGDTGAFAGTRAAVEEARSIAAATRDAGAALEPFLVYRLILALPFPEHAVPDRPPLVALSPSPPPTTVTGSRCGSAVGTAARTASAVSDPVPETAGAASRDSAAVASPPSSALDADAAGGRASDPFAASRALGRVFDSVRLTNTLLRSTATRAVDWASRRVRAIADARRAVLFPPPPRPPPEQPEAPVAAVGDTLLLVCPASPSTEGP